jgi:hypothetical protein
VVTAGQPPEPVCATADGTQNFWTLNFWRGSSERSHPSLFLPLVRSPPSQQTIVNMANQADAAKTDPLSGMAHSEAHYFNRYHLTSPSG